MHSDHAAGNDGTEPKGREAGGLRDRVSGKTDKKGITIERHLLARIDKHAAHLGISRSALLSIAASMFIDNLLERRRE
jgi:hypothetical protein